MGSEIRERVAFRGLCFVRNLLELEGVRFLPTTLWDPKCGNVSGFAVWREINPERLEGVMSFLSTVLKIIYEDVTLSVTFT